MVAKRFLLVAKSTINQLSLTSSKNFNNKTLAGSVKKFTPLITKKIFLFL